MKGLLQRVYYSIYDNKFNFIQILLRALTRSPGQIDGHKSSMQYSVKLPWPSREWSTLREAFFKKFITKFQVNNHSIYVWFFHLGKVSPSYFNKLLTVKNANYFITNFF